jgi:hypothetical protein
MHLKQQSTDVYLRDWLHRRALRVEDRLLQGQRQPVHEQRHVRVRAVDCDVSMRSWLHRSVLRGAGESVLLESVRARPVQSAGDVSGRRQWLHVHVLERVDRRALRDRGECVRERAVSQERHLLPNLAYQLQLHVRGRLDGPEL